MLDYLNSILSWEVQILEHIIFYDIDRNVQDDRLTKITCQAANNDVWTCAWCIVS